MALRSARLFKSALRMIFVGLGCLIVAGVGFASHVVILGVVFLILMVLCGVAGFVSPSSVTTVRPLRSTRWCVSRPR